MAPWEEMAKTEGGQAMAQSSMGRGQNSNQAGLTRQLVLFSLP